MRIPPLAFVIVLTAAPLARGAPSSFVYEGYLENGGTPVAGAHDVAFALYVSAGAPTSLYDETHLDVAFAGGYFAVVVGEQGGLDADVVEQAPYLEVVVDSTSLGRQRILAVPLASRAASVDWADVQAVPAGFADGTDDIGAAIDHDHDGDYVRVGTAANVAYVANSGTTNSWTFTNLATAGPSLTTTIGASGAALVTVQARVSAGNSDPDPGCVVAVAVSGATTVAAADIHGWGWRRFSGDMRGAATFLMTGLNPGSNTFTLQYRTWDNDNNCQFAERRLTVLPM